jgi:hypothetical protein
VKTLEQQLAEYCQHQEEVHSPITPEELFKPAQGPGDNLTVLDLRQRREPEHLERDAGPAWRKRWAVLGVVAATVLLVASVIVVNGDNATVATDSVSSATTPDAVASPTVPDPTPPPEAVGPPPSVLDPVSSYRWSRVATDDEAVFGENREEWMGSVAVGGPGLVAVGAAVWTSVDGLTWSRVRDDEATFAHAPIHSVTIGGPGLVAVGVAFGDEDERACPGSVPATQRLDCAAVWTSVDGLTWSRVPHDEAIFGGAAMTSVTAGGPGVVAVGWDGHPHGEESNAVVWTSVDGLTWSRVPHDEAIFGNATGSWMWSVTAGGPGLVAVGYDGGWYDGDADRDANAGDAVVWTSVDGVTWSRVPHNEAVFGDAEMRSVTAGGPGLVAVGDDWDGEDGHASVWTSVDGITWSEVPHDEAVFGNAGMTSVTAGGPGLVAAGSDAQDNAAVWTSVDGVTWSRVPHDEAVFGAQRKPVEMSSVIAGGPGLVAVGASSIDNPNNTGDVALWLATFED